MKLTRLSEEIVCKEHQDHLDAVKEIIYQIFEDLSDKEGLLSRHRAEVHCARHVPPPCDHVSYVQRQQFLAS